MTQQPLAGITVLDFSTLLPGPLASLMLAEAGAAVIKIERPGGEDMRFFPPKAGPASALYAMLNRGKTCVELDLKDPAARERVLELVDGADVVLEQFRPGVMARLGLGPQDLAARNPRLIYCSITGFGQGGPRAPDAGHDITYMALTGLLALSCGTGEAPVLPPAQIADIGGGSFPAVMNILLALIARERSGRGAVLDIAMCDAMFTFALFAQAKLTATGRGPGNGADLLTGASPRYRIYAAGDGGLIAVGALEEKFWTALCDVVGLPEAARDDRRDPDGTGRALAAAFAAQDTAYWAPRLAAADCCAAPLATLAEAFADPHFRERGLFDFDVTTGDVTLPATVVPIAPVFRGARSARAPV
ncbi:CaiB/BaiF CoA-transferase family protein [Stappia sp. TSB10P1A]|uniref:CaiB/BaiF CoA transferase family protein n=1 Tax=Stappia sp. TSB10P1A TaxID=2003585 RepID=UPI001643E4AE|nr:CoA transferase [Stappia sp. TSB10P1A]